MIQFKSLQFLPFFNLQNNLYFHYIYTSITIFQRIKRIQDCLPPFKDKIPLSIAGDYKIPCTCGACYIGQSIDWWPLD